MLSDKQKIEVESYISKHPDFSAKTIAAKLGLTKEYVDVYLKAR